MKNDEHLYLDVVELSERGWTETLIRRFLGAPDGWKAVNHWANWTGKRTYFLERVLNAEDSPEFADALSRSFRRRKISPSSQMELAHVTEKRAKDRNAVREWRESLTDEDRKIKETLNEVVEIFEEARRRGYRTPHKA